MENQEAQENKPLFTSEEESYPLTIITGDILLHKKLRTAEGYPMVYIVKEVGTHTEGDRPRMVAYQSLYDGEVHFRPMAMFNSDRFCILTHTDFVKKAMNW